MIFEIATSEIMIAETMTSDKPISGRCRSRVESSELGKRCCAVMPASPMPRWMVTALFGWLVLSGLGWAQTTLRTPSAGDPQCVEQDCPTDPRPSGGNDDPMPGRAGNPAATAPRSNGTLPDIDNNHNNNNNNEERGQNAEPARHRKPVFPLQTDAIPEPPPSEFQEFVANSVGRRLPIYGHNLFDHVPTTFAPVDRIPVTDNYMIGPGDEILIRAWGQIDLNGKLVVDRDGAVFLPKVGALAVAGLKYQQLPQYFRTAIGRVFRNFDLTVSLGQLRSIQVFVVGQVRRPGSYTVSSLCTLVNALFASGGPSGTGSMRQIQLKRNSSVVTEFDFYDLLLKGDKSKDARLLPGDVIYIPPSGPSIAIAGSVNVPAIYELREGTSLASAIEMAGGLATTADGQKAVVERIENHNTRRVEEFPLDGRGLERPLKDGDVVRIFSLSPRFQNSVTLRGNVAHPGRTEWHSGMRLKDVIPNQDALVTRDYWRATNWVANAGERDEQRISRDYWRATNPVANPGERGGPPTIRDYGRAPSPVANAGERDDQQFERQPASAKAATAATTAKLRNQIAHNAPEINWDYAVIQRLNPQDLTTRLVPFNLGKLVLEGDEQSNLALEPGDVITIFSQNDLAVPLEKQSKFVRLEGEFRTAGVYQAEAGETVRHLVERVGGFTSNAYLYGAEFTRESARIDQQKGLDQLIEKLEEDISRNAMAPSGVNPDEVADNRAKLEAQRQLVGKLREIKATGRVVLDLTPNSTGVNDLPEIALEDGDRFVVPYRPSTVEMMGAVYNKNSFLYRREARVDDYLKRAGGPTRDADTGRMFVIRADGSVLSRQSVKGLWNGGFASLRLMPGDAIVVPERLSHGSFLRGLRDWSQVFSQFALGAAAVKVIQ
ncbi:MAG: SLBB domain-containing protein [Terriglobales bacterium]